MSTSPLTSEERETVVTVTDSSDVVNIWTCRRKDITRLRKHDSYTQIRSGFHGSTEWAEFTIPADSWNPATGAKRKRVLTEEQRTELADRFNKNLGRD